MAEGTSYKTVQERAVSALCEILSREDAERVYQTLLLDGLLVSEAALAYLEEELEEEDG